MDSRKQKKIIFTQNFPVCPELVKFTNAHQYFYAFKRE
jgi:hypothetical protein